MHNICTFLGLWTQIIFLNVHSWTAGRNKELACIYHIKPDPTNPPVLLCSRFTWNWNAVLPTWEKTWGKALHIGRDDMYDYVVLDRRHMLYNNAESLAVEKKSFNVIFTLFELSHRILVCMYKMRKLSTFFFANKQLKFLDVYIKFKKYCGQIRSGKFRNP